MTSLAYYNEIDEYCAQWLRNLIDAGHIAPGLVDERDIRDVRPDELRGFAQVHLFAGVGVWSHALRTAGWSDDREVWTISCPCQPFSAAGRGAGFDDERHLWPHAFRLLQECRPVTVFGEQVASPDGLIWLDLVQADLEGAGYATAALDLCAAGVGAPHIRQRLYWVGESDRAGLQPGRSGPSAARHGSAAVAAGGVEWMGDTGRASHEPQRRPREAHGAIGAAKGEMEQRQRGRAADCPDGSALGLADARPAEWQRGDGSGSGIGNSEGTRGRHPVLDSGVPPFGLADASPEGFPQRLGNPGVPGGTAGADAGQAAVGGDVRAAGNVADPRRCAACDGLCTTYCDDEFGADARAGDVADARSDRPQGGEPAVPPAGGRRSADPGDQSAARPGPVNGFWADADWLLCRDGKWRPTQSRIFPLAHGITGSVGQLRAYGNAICAPLAASFIEAYLTRE